MSRLTDVHMSYQEKYLKDWMDEIQGHIEKWSNKISDYESESKQIKKEAIEKARMTILPSKLKEIFPLMEKESIDPQDMKGILHPLDFVSFDGLNSRNSLDRILLLDAKANRSYREDLQKEIASLVEQGKYDWNVLRVDEKGNIESE